MVYPCFAGMSSTTISHLSLRNMWNKLEGLDERGTFFISFILAMHDDISLCCSFANPNFFLNKLKNVKKNLMTLRGFGQGQCWDEHCKF